MSRTQQLEESALELFGRLERRISLEGLDNLLFSTGPRHKEVIEISGEPGSGKTYLMVDLLSKCLLPVTYGACAIGGLGSGVVLFNHDQHFNICILVRFMECRVKMNSNIDHIQIQEVILLSLKRLLIFNIFSEEERLAALQSTKNLLCLNKNISIVAMDSISAFYWDSIARSGNRKIDSYVVDVLNSVNRALGTFKVTFLYTRPLYFFSKSGDTADISSAFCLKNVNTRIKLKQHLREKQPARLVEIHSGSSLNIVFYDISENGFIWNK